MELDIGISRYGCHQDLPCLRADRNDHVDIASLKVESLLIVPHIYSCDIDIEGFTGDILRLACAVSADAGIAAAAYLGKGRVCASEIVCPHPVHYEEYQCKQQTEDPQTFALAHEQYIYKDQQHKKHCHEGQRHFLRERAYKRKHHHEGRCYQSHDEHDESVPLLRQE